MTRSLTLSALAAASLFASAASAQGYYSATPSLAPTRASMITGEMMWKCTGGVCTTSRGTSRDAIVCEKVVKHVGTLTTFKAGGAAFDEAALARCNARAK